MQCSIYLIGNKQGAKMPSQRQWVFSNVKNQPKKGSEVIIEGVPYYVISAIRLPNRANSWLASVTKFKKFC